MPELPEVTINARNLRAWTRGRTIVRVTPPLANRERNVSARTFQKLLAGERIEAVRRVGKWMICALRGGGGLGLHLGMTGKLLRAAKGEPLPRFTRARFELDRGESVCFVDLRRFGRIWVTQTLAALTGAGEIAGIGPDALTLTAATLRDVLGSTSRTVKETIMDQAKIGGIGNLYAAEALWRARIHPATPARRVAADPKATGALLRGIKAALAQGLKTFGAEEIPEYLEEGAPNPFYAYDRVGLMCRRCRRGKIAKIMLGGRTSAFCPVCQPRPTSRP